MLPPEIQDVNGFANKNASQLISTAQEQGGRDEEHNDDVSNACLLKGRGGDIAQSVENNEGRIARRWKARSCQAPHSKHHINFLAEMGLDFAEAAAVKVTENSKWRANFCSSDEDRVPAAGGTVYTMPRSSTLGQLLFVPSFSLILISIR